MKDTKSFYDYLGSDNPFAFLNDFEKNNFRNDDVKRRLEAIQKLQPKFVPCSIDPYMLSKEHNCVMNHVIKNGINENIFKGMEILNKYGVNYEGSDFQLVNASEMVDNASNNSELQEICFNVNTVNKPKFNLSKIYNILETFKRHINLDNMDDIILEIYRLKLLDKQKILRNKIFEAIKEKLDDDVISRIDFKTDISEDPLIEAKRLVELENKLNNDI